MNKSDDSMGGKISFVCKVFGVVFVGLLGIYFMCSGRNQEQAILKNAKACFGEALQEEKKNSMTQVYMSYDASKTTYTLDDVLDWAAQATSIKKDSCRYGLDSIYHAKLTQAGYSVQTAISYTMNGRTTVSKPNLDLSHMYPIENKVYSMKHDTIRLQAYIPIAFMHTQKYKFSIGLGMVICSILAWLVFLLAGRKNWYVSADPVFAEKTMPKQPDSSLSQMIHITGNYYWDVPNRTLYYKDKKVVLNGLMLSYFELFIQSETHTITYADILSLYGEQSQLSVTTKNKIYQSIGNLKKVLHEMPLKIEAITNVGYRIHFNEEV